MAKQLPWYVTCTVDFSFTNVSYVFQTFHILKNVCFAWKIIPLIVRSVQNPKEALNYLKKARADSEKKIWNASKVLGKKQNSIFKECNILLYKILLIFARDQRCENPSSALNACIEAAERATDGKLYRVPPILS